MPQQPFTPAGVQQKQVDLYALSNNALLVEANAIRNDLKAWLITNFIMTAAQQTYLNGMSSQFIQLASCRTGFAVENRVPIVLDAPTPLPPPSMSKIVRTKDFMNGAYSQASGFVVTGQLVFELVY
jgi:hypothetical protein